MAKARKSTSKRKRNGPQKFYTMRVLNPAGFDPYAAAVPHEPRARAVNPSVRYTVVPVDDDDDGENDVSYVVRGGKRAAAMRAVANEVDPDAWIDVEHTRTFATKREAEAHGKKVSPQLRALQRRVSQGGR